jgi:hypothetical protein
LPHRRRFLIASANAFAPMSAQSSRLVSLQAEKAAKIPDAVSQGPQEGQIPAADNNKKGEKTMESLAIAGKNQDRDDSKDDDDKKDE